MVQSFGSRRAEWITHHAPPTLARSPRRSWRASRRSTSSTARCARCSTTTCRSPATRAARSRRAASSQCCCSTRWTTTSRDPTREDADIVSYAAGHKALGLYALWALRNEVARIARARRCCPRDVTRPAAARGPARLPPQSDHRDAAVREVRREGARRPPDAGHAVRAALDRRLRRRPRRLDRPRAGRARPATAATRRACTSSRARAASRPAASPRRSPPRARARSATSSLHVDWNQASIDSNRVCRDGDDAGRLRAVEPDGAVLPARLERDRGPRTAATSSRSSRRSARRRRIDNGQPTAIVYRTVKGWQYGIEGRASHGAGHKLCSDGFYQALVRAVGARPAARCPPARARHTAARRAATAPRRSRRASGTRCCCCATRSRSDRPTPRLMAARLARRARAARRTRGASRARRAAGRRRVYALAAGGDAMPAGAGAEAGHRRPRCATSSAARSRYFNKAIGRRAARRRGRPARLDQRQHGRGRLPARASGTRGANPVSRTLSIGGICEDAHDRHALGPRGLRPPRRRRLVLRRLPGAARSHRRAAARDRQPGAQRPHGAVEPDGARVRARGPQDRRGRPDARRPAAAAAAPGELPARHRDHAHAVGPAGAAGRCSRRRSRRRPGGRSRRS